MMSTSIGTYNVIDIAKSNPIAFVLAALVLLGLILPPRKRKFRPKKKRSRRRRKTITKSRIGKRRTSVKRKILPTKNKTARTVKRPARMVKGSKAAKDYMRNLRSRRKK